MAVSQNLTLTQLSQNIANNTSQVRMLWTSTQSGSSHNDYTRTGYWNFDNQNGTVDYTLPANTTKTILDKTFTVYHNADGTKKVEASTWMATGISAGEVRKTASLTLTTIPRGSTAYVNNPVIGHLATITVSRNSSSFTHTITYTFGKKTGTVTTKSSSTSISWTVPANFADEIPNDNHGDGTLTTYTYSGDTLVGTKTSKFTAYLGEDYRPIINPSSSVDTTTYNLTGSHSIFIQGYSTVNIGSQVTTKNGATLTSHTCVNNGVTKNFANNITTWTAPTTNEFAITATDQHKLTAKKNYVLNMVKYQKPTCVVEASTPSATGTVTIKISGVFTSVNFGKKNNTLVIDYHYKTRSGEYGSPITITNANINASNNTYSAEATITGLDYKQTYVIQAAANDATTTIYSAEVTVVAVPVFDWGKNDFNFNVPVKVLEPTESYNPASKGYVDNSLLNKIYPVGSIYMSVNNNSPANFLGGTWESIGGRFLLGADDTYKAGATGGEAKHKLTIAEMPKHNHGQNAAMQDSSNYSGSMNVDYDSWTSQGRAIWQGCYTNNTGGDEAHNNMPPYLSVYMWKRTA